MSIRHEREDVLGALPDILSSIPASPSTNSRFQISPALLTQQLQHQQQQQALNSRTRKTSSEDSQRRGTGVGVAKRSSIVPVSLRSNPPEAGEALALLFTLRSSVSTSTDMESVLRSQIVQCEERREKLKQKLAQTPSAPELHQLLAEAFNEQEAELQGARRKLRELLERNQLFATQEGQGLKKLFEAMRTAAPKNMQCNEICAKESEYEVTKQGELSRLLLFIDKLKLACNEKCVCHVSKGSRKCYLFFLASFFHCDGLECIEQYLRDEMFQKHAFLCLAVYMGHALALAKSCMGGLVKLPKLKPGQYWRDRTLPVFSEHLKVWQPLAAEQMDLLLRLITDNLEKTSGTTSVGVSIVNPFMMPWLFQQIALTSESVKLGTLDMLVWLVNKKANAEIVSTQDDWWTWALPLLDGRAMSREVYVRGILFTSSVLIAGINMKSLKDKEDVPMWLFMDNLKAFQPDNWTEDTVQLVRDVMLAVMGTISTSIGATEFSSLFDWDKTAWADAAVLLVECLVEFVFFRPTEKDTSKKPRSSFIPRKIELPNLPQQAPPSDSTSPRSHLAIPDEEESGGPRRFSESGENIDGQLRNFHIKSFLTNTLQLHLSESKTARGQGVATFLTNAQEAEEVKFLDLPLIHRTMDMLKALRLDKEMEEQVQCPIGERKAKAKGSQEFKFLSSLAILLEQIEDPKFFSLPLKSADGGKGIEAILDELSDLRHVKTTGLFRRKKVFEPDKLARRSKIEKTAPTPTRPAALSISNPTRGRSMSSTARDTLDVKTAEVSLSTGEKKIIEVNQNGEYLGNLRKKSGGNRGTWQTRFFVLNSSALLYYSDEQTYRKKARQAQFKSLKVAAVKDKKEVTNGKLKEADGARTIPLHTIKQTSIQRGVRGVPDGVVLVLYLTDSTSHGGLFELMAANPQECSEWQTAINSLLPAATASRSRSETPTQLRMVPPPPPGSPVTSTPRMLLARESENKGPTITTTPATPTT